MVRVIVFPERNSIFCYNPTMKRLLPVLMVFGVFLGSAGESFALPECSRSYNSNTWTDCVGTYIFADGSKYVGEYRDGIQHGQGTYTYADGKIRKGFWENGQLKYPQIVSPTVTARKPPKPLNEAQKELKKLRKEIARLKEEKRKQSKPKKVAKKTPQPTPKTATSGSGFFVSRSGHVITNQHVVNKCKKVSVGYNAKKQVTADILDADRRNDLALLKISSLQTASVDTKSLIKKLGVKIVPLASGGLMRS